jgi:hypothetical protein
VGMMMLLLAETGFHSYGMFAGECKKKMWWLIVSGLLAFTKILGMDSEEADKVCRNTTAATKNKSLHSYAPQ